jgi:DNA repair exonuclease SbcCD ATPase subunit
VKKQENLSSSLSGLNTLKNETLERVQAEHNSNLNRLRTVESKVEALDFGRRAIGERLEKIVEDHNSDSRTLSVLLDRISCLEQDTISLQDRLALTKRLMDQLSPSASQDLMKEIAEILQRFQKLVSTGACSDSTAKDINHLKREILGLTEFVTELSKIFVESMELVHTSPPLLYIGSH